MRPFLMIVFLTLFPLIATAAPAITFSRGQVLGLWKFTNSITNGRNDSEIVNKIYLKSRYNNDVNAKLIHRLQKIREGHFGRSYHFNGYPENRDSMLWQLSKFFTLQGALSKDLQDFSTRTISLIPAFEHRKLFSILRLFKPIYEELIWNSSRKYLCITQIKMEKMLAERNASSIFDKIRGFYNASWPDSEAFNIVIYPIPTDKGSLSATIIANTVILPVRIYQKDVTGSVGVIFHELCHSLYDGQSSEFQKYIDTHFHKSRSLDAKYAYALINEGLATAIGNGWVYEKLSGKPDKSDWYNDFEINGFSKAICKEVKRYLAVSEPIDDKFLEFAINKYSELFPYAASSYTNLLCNIWLGTGSKFRPREVLNVVARTWRLKETSLSSPLDHKFTLQSYKQKSAGAVTIIVFSDYEEFKGLALKVEALHKSAQFLKSQTTSGVLTFFDKHGKAFLVFKVDTLKEFEALMMKLHSLKVMNKEQTFIAVK